MCGYRLAKIDILGHFVLFEAPSILSNTMRGVKKLRECIEDDNLKHRSSGLFVYLLSPLASHLCQISSEQ